LEPFLPILATVDMQLAIHTGALRDFLAIVLMGMEDMVFMVDMVMEEFMARERQNQDILVDMVDMVPPLSMFPRLTMDMDTILSHTLTDTTLVMARDPLMLSLVMLQATLTEAHKV